MTRDRPAALSSSSLLLCALGALAAPGACTPTLTVRASRVTAPRVVAVRADPPEARPNETVMLRALVVTPDGPVDDAPIEWASCLVPRPPTETTTVSSACLTEGALPDGGSLVTPFASGHATASLDVPEDACRRVGPLVPPSTGDAGQRQRPPDPDVTGGYQLPVRVTLEAQGAARDVSFARPRLHCNLPDLPIDVARELDLRARPNQNPALGEVDLWRADGWTVLARQGRSGQELPAVDGANVPLLAQWDEGQAETYVMVDPVSGQVVERAERLELTWFTQAGSLEHDRTAPDESGTASGNVLHLDASYHGVAYVWVVMRDDRSGTDFATFAVQVP